MLQNQEYIYMLHKPGKDMQKFDQAIPWYTSIIQNEAGDIFKLFLTLPWWSVVYLVGGQI
jgi:hypothetical protein